MNIEDKIRGALHGGADDLHVIGRGPAVARRRAQRIERRRRLAVPATLTVTVLTGAGAIVWMQSGPSAAPPSAAEGRTLDANAFEWRAADVGLGGARAVTRDADGTFYVLSTAPGTKYEDFPDGAVPQAIYRSADGATWETQAVDGDPWISAISAHGDALYALGTAPATKGGVNTVAGRSGDGGETWSSVELTSEVAPPAASVPLVVSSPDVRFATGDRGLVAVVTRNYSVAESVILTAADRAAGRNWSVTPDGIAISEDRPLSDACSPKGVPTTAAPADAIATTVPSRESVTQCAETVVVRTEPWSAFGIGDPTDLMVNEVFVSNDGEAWTSVGAPLSVGYVGSVVATSDGFFATVEPPTAADVRDVDGMLTASDLESSPSELWFSADGRDWEPRSADLAESIRQLSAVGNQLFAVSSANSGQETIVTSTDGGATWTSLDPASIVDPDGRLDQLWINAVDSGPLGFAVVVSGSEQEGGPTESYLLMRGEGSDWSATRLDGSLPTESDSPLYVTGVVVGTDDVSVSAVLQNPAAPAQAEARTFVGSPRR